MCYIYTESGRSATALPTNIKYHIRREKLDHRVSNTDWHHSVLDRSTPLGVNNAMNMTPFDIQWNTQKQTYYWIELTKNTVWRF